MNPEEFKKVARAVSLSLDSPESVKKQGNRLVAARNRLKEYHQQIVAVEQRNQQPPFPVAELEDDPSLFKRLMAIQQNSEVILDDAQWLRLIIESLAIECNQLIARAKKYLNPEGASAPRPPIAKPQQPTQKGAQATPKSIAKPRVAQRKKKSGNSSQPTESTTAPNPARPQMPEGLDWAGKAAFWIFPPSKGKFKWLILVLALCLWFIVIPWLIWTKTRKETSR